MSFTQDDSSESLVGDAVHDLREAKKALDTEYERYMRNKILMDAVHKSLASDRLDDELKDKVRNIVLGQECAQALSLETRGFHRGTSTVLGVTNLGDIELNFTEGKRLVGEVSAVLVDDIREISEEFRKMTGHDIDNVQPAGDEGEASLVHFRQRLMEERRLYVHNMEVQLGLLEEVAKLRLDEVPKVSEDKLRECQIVSKRNLLRSRIAEAKGRLDVFNETKSSFAAYEELAKDIRQQQDECRADIERLQELKEKYKQVSCKQFDEILKSYIQYKTSIEKKKILYDALNN